MIKMLTSDTQEKRLKLTFLAISQSQRPPWREMRRLLTRPMMAAPIPMRGLTEMITKVSFQPWKNPSRNPQMLVVMRWMKMAIWSAMASLILLISLETREALITKVHLVNSNVLLRNRGPPHLCTPLPLGNIGLSHPGKFAAAWEVTQPLPSQPSKLVLNPVFPTGVHETLAKVFGNHLICLFFYS